MVNALPLVGWKPQTDSSLFVVFDPEFSWTDSLPQVHVEFIVSIQNLIL